jgi:transcriptional regulator with XRE-family HTH domain
VDVGAIMPNQPLVYFFAKSNFGDTQPDFIKIGYTTDLSGRQANLQTGSESRIWEIGVIPFEMEDEARGEERRLHEWFGGFRAYGEWFYATPRIIKYIRNYAVQHTELLTAEMPSETEDSSEVSFGEQLRERRNDANITQEELATKVGCTRGYISFLENNRGTPGQSIYTKLVESFGEFSETITETGQIELFGEFLEPTIETRFNNLLALKWQMDVGFQRIRQ